MSIRAIRLHTSCKTALGLLLVFLVLFLVSSCASNKHVQPDLREPAEKTASTLDQPAPDDVKIPGLDDTEEELIADPIEPWNRAMFTFNDKLYFWVMKPVITGYNWVLPEPVRKSVRNFFFNLEMPARFISSVLQAEAKAAGIELARFGINSTIGLAGFFDVAENAFEIKRQEKDLGQTLGKYGVGEGFYIVWPFTGPSNPRDTIGSCVELFLSPWFQVQLHSSALASSLGMYDYFNTASLHTNDYEELVNAAVEPYVALKNAYVQYRRNIVKNK